MNGISIQATRLRTLLCSPFLTVQNTKRPSVNPALTTMRITDYIFPAFTLAQRFR